MLFLPELGCFRRIANHCIYIIQLLFRKKECTETTVNILKIDQLNGRSHSKTTYIKAVFPDGTEKDLFPPHQIYKDWKVGSNQTIYVQEGLWGYDVVKW